AVLESPELSAAMAAASICYRPRRSTPLFVSATGQRLGKYHVLDRLAQGGMAEIYKVKTVGIAGFEKVQVLKRILPAYAQNERFIRAFVDEARIAVSLNHRNI